MLMGYLEKQASPPQFIWGLLYAMGSGKSLEALLTGTGGCRVSVDARGSLCSVNNPDAER